MKKLILLLVIGVLVFALAFSCGKDETKPQEEDGAEAETFDSTGDSTPRGEGLEEEPFDSGSDSLPKEEKLKSSGVGAPETTPAEGDGADAETFEDSGKAPTSEEVTQESSGG
jgi:hypothetical protein